MTSKPMSTSHTTMLDWVDAHSADTIDLLQKLVRIPSITGDEARIGAFVADYCRGLGFSVEILEAEPGRPNIIATMDSGIPGPTLMLNDHLDMIPPGPLEFWTYPPFAAEIHDGRVYGRATIDTKSGLTTILTAARALVTGRLPIRGKLLLVFTCDEEVGGLLGMQYLGKIGRLKADMALVAEPTSMQLEIGTKGRLNIEITTQGVATHGARPWLGQNAIEDMFLVIEALGDLAKSFKLKQHPLLGQPSLNVGLIQGGTVPNMVPNHCRIEVDRRVLPDETPESALLEIRSLLDRLSNIHPKLRCGMSNLLWWPGYAISETEPVVKIASRAFEKVVGRAPRIAGKDAGTDASWISKLGHIPVVMFSPGDGFKAMNVDENVSIDDLIAASKVVTQFVADVLCTNAGSP